MVGKGNTNKIQLKKNLNKTVLNEKKIEQRKQNIPLGTLGSQHY